MAGSGGRFVGIGVGRYERAAYPALPRAVSDVQQLADLLKGFEGEPLVDPTRNEVNDHLQLLPDSMSSGGSLVLLWSGHGRGLVGDLRLITTDSPDNLGAGISAEEVVRQAALSGAGQLLFIFDTCFSGAVVASAASVAVALPGCSAGGCVSCSGTGRVIPISGAAGRRTTPPAVARQRITVRGSPAEPAR